LSCEFFSGHAADLLRLAEDESRMLGRAEVEPEHMLLAFCRHGHGWDLLEQQSLQPRDLHAAVVRIGGEGDDLLLGRLPRSRRSQEVLERVVTVAASRGLAWAVMWRCCWPWSPMSGLSRFYMRPVWSTWRS
jgi:hypothetical protein